LIYSEGVLSRRQAIKVVIGVLVALLVIAGLIVLAFLNGQLLVDIVLILAALFSLIAFALLGYAALQVIGLVKEVRGEFEVLIGTAQESLTEVRGTAQFVGDTVVQPVSQAAGWISATRATLKAFTEPLYKDRG
jgi:hypothetical protein